MSIYFQRLCYIFLCILFLSSPLCSSSAVGINGNSDPDQMNLTESWTLNSGNPSGSGSRFFLFFETFQIPDGSSCANNSLTMTFDNTSFKFCNSDTKVYQRNPDGSLTEYYTQAFMDELFQVSAKQITVKFYTSSTNNASFQIYFFEDYCNGNSGSLSSKVCQTSSCSSWCRPSFYTTTYDFCWGSSYNASVESNANPGQFWVMDQFDYCPDIVLVSKNYLTSPRLSNAGSPSPSYTSSSLSSSTSGLNAGAVAGIVLGGVLCINCVAYFIYRQRRNVYFDHHMELAGEPQHLVKTPRTPGRIGEREFEGEAAAEPETLVENVKTSVEGGANVTPMKIPAAAADEE